MILRRSRPPRAPAKGLTLAEVRDFVAETATAPDSTEVRARITMGGRLRLLEVAYEEPAGWHRPPGPRPVRRPPPGAPS